MNLAVFTEEKSKSNFLYNLMGPKVLLQPSDGVRGEGRFKTHVFDTVCRERLLLN